MTFDLRPFHVARIVLVLSVIPAIWIFCLEGVTTTTEFNLRTGITSSSDTLGAHFAKAAVFIVPPVGFAFAERYLRQSNATGRLRLSDTWFNWVLTPLSASPGRSRGPVVAIF